MSTRSVFTFKDVEPGKKIPDKGFNVYKHHDGYPEGALHALQGAIEFFAWPLPRYEADEFAAAFVTAAKCGIWENDLTRIKEYGPGGRYHEMRGGSIRLMEHGDPRKLAPADIEYRYVIHNAGADLHVECWQTNYWKRRTEHILFSGTFAEFAEWVRARLKAEDAA